MNIIDQNFYFILNKKSIKITFDEKKKKNIDEKNFNKFIRKYAQNSIRGVENI